MRTALLIAAAACMGCAVSSAPVPPPRADLAARIPILRDVDQVRWPARGERVVDFSRFTADAPFASPHDLPPPARSLERISTAVPWPRGLAWVDGRLLVLARGRHRRAGGVDPDIDDASGYLFEVDPDVSEVVEPGKQAGEAVRRNGVTFAAPDPEVFRLPDRSKTPIEDYGMERPYCTLAYDPVSRNLFVCGFSGVDLPGGRFRKNATDSILRYDLRVQRWFVVERHRAEAVPDAALGITAPNDAYPHHDPTTNPPPHGWLNGVDACTVVGGYLYAAGKDNHLVARYDLEPVRRDPFAGPLPSEVVLGPRVVLSHPCGETEVELLGPSAIAAWGDYLYVGYRTSSVIVRFVLDDEGRVADPHRAQWIAAFAPYDPETKKSANLIDIAFDPDGRLWVSCAYRGEVWCIGVPDPEHPFLGDDRPGRVTSARPFLHLPSLLGKKAGVGNLLFDSRGRLLVCSGSNDTGSPTLAGTIYRAAPPRAGAPAEVR